MLLVKVTSKRQVTLPARVLEVLGVKPGDRLLLEESPAGFVLRPRRVNTDLAHAIRTRFAPLVGVELQIPTRDPMRDPPRFD